MQLKSFKKLTMLLTKKLALNLKPNPNLTSTRACTIKFFIAVTCVLVSWCVRHKTDTTGPSIKILIYCWSPQNCETIKNLIKHKTLDSLNGVKLKLTKLVAPSPLPTVLPPFRYILKWPTNMYSSIYSWPHLIHNSQVVWLIKVFKKKLWICFVPTTSTSWGSMKANGREPKSCLGQVFNFKLSCSIAAKNNPHATIPRAENLTQV
jgi:hypothetical protein